MPFSCIATVCYTDTALYKIHFQVKFSHILTTQNDPLLVALANKTAGKAKYIMTASCNNHGNDSAVGGGYLVGHCVTNLISTEGEVGVKTINHGCFDTVTACSIEAYLSFLGTF